MQTRIAVLRQFVALALLVVAGYALLASASGRLRAGPPPLPDAAAVARDPAVPSSPTPGDLHRPRPTFTPAAGETAPTPEHDRVGLLAGHWRYDTGAICPDGLREVDVTLDVAQRTAAILEARGYVVDLLPEHDPDVPAAPLQGYRAAAFVSIHADSCEVAGASGFKVARWLWSGMPAVDDRLVGCLNEAYAAATGLTRHADSITIDMTNYYAFREIALDTPGAIIELGFLHDDRAQFDAHRYEMARGIADGISCFLDASEEEGS
jgi:N-acetylmuramoyl-L-alanine amidase